MGVIILNTTIGFWMEYQAQQSITALKKFEKIKSMVIREGEQVALNAEELVPVDLILFDAGNVIPADGRIIEYSE